MQKLYTFQRTLINFPFARLETNLLYIHLYSSNIWQQL